MKKLVLTIVVLIITNSFAQQIQQPFSKLDIGFYGGINFINTSKIGTIFFLEGKTNLLSQLNLKFSVGFTKIILDDKYEIRGFRVSFDGVSDTYQTHKIIVEQVSYDVIPIVIGTEYAFIKKLFTTYALFEVGYNLVSENKNTSEEIKLETYNSITQLPIEHFMDTERHPPRESINVGLGLGIKYPISNSIYIDLRYIRQYHDNMDSSNEFLLGINF